EMALGDEFGLAEHEFDFAFRDTGRPLFDVDELFGRHGEENDVAGEVAGDPGFCQSDRRAQHPGDLRVVATAVGRPGDRIGERVLRGPQAVELADKGEPGAWRSTGQPALDTGQRQTGAGRQAKGPHLIGDQSGRLHLVEAGLRMAEDRLAEIDDGVGVAVNGLADRSLQLVFAAHSDPSLRLSAALCAPASQLTGMTQKDQTIGCLNYSVGRSCWPSNERDETYLPI